MQCCVYGCINTFFFLFLVLIIGLYYIVSLFIQYLCFSHNLPENIWEDLNINTANFGLWVQTLTVTCKHFVLAQLYNLMNL